MSRWDLTILVILGLQISTLGQEVKLSKVFDTLEVLEDKALIDYKLFEEGRIIEEGRAYITYNEETYRPKICIPIINLCFLKIRRKRTWKYYGVANIGKVRFYKEDGSVKIDEYRRGIVFSSTSYDALGNEVPQVNTRPDNLRGPCGTNIQRLWMLSWFE